MSDKREPTFADAIARFNEFGFRYEFACRSRGATVTYRFIDHDGPQRQEAAQRVAMGMK